MPPLTDHQSNTTAKCLLVGDSGGGKTGSLASLAASGYKLRVLDYDNGLDILRDYLTNPLSPYVKKDPNCAANVRFITLQDPQGPIPGKPGQMMPMKVQAWNAGMGLLNGWKEADGTDLGPLTSWGSDCVLVVDSLSFLSRAAHNAFLAMNGLLGKDRSGYDGQRDIGVVQDMLRKFLDILFDAQVKCNVILTSHITFVADSGGKPGAEGQDRTGKGYPSAIGRALSPHIPRWFNNSLVVNTIGVGAQAKHKILTNAQFVGGQIVNAKSSAPLRVKPEYDIEWGLAEYFAAVKGGGA